MSLPERQEVVFKNKLCYNCLYPGHQIRQCRGGNCNKCGKRHNTKLHSDASLNPSDSVNVQSSSTPETQSIVTFVELGTKNTSVPTQIILATALVNLTNADGQHIQCRAKLDSGSQVCLITKKCASKLNISVVKSSLSIAGIGSVTAKTGTKLSTSLCSRLNDFEVFIDFHVINSITNNLPTHRINMEPLLIPSTISNCLADPQFNEPASIDILLGAEIFFELLIGESVKISPFITIHNTILGWVFTGSTKINDVQPTSTSLLLRHCGQSAVTLVSRSCSTGDSSDSRAEDHFKANVSHDDLGRFVVKLPFVQDPSSLGDSKTMAQQRFFNLERKLQKNPSLASDYQKFMNE